MLVLLLALAALLAPSLAGAQNDPGNQGVCAQVKLEIPQELTFERVAFEGRLRVSNDDPDIDLQNVMVELYIWDDAADADTTTTFFIQNPKVEGTMTGLPDGTGTIPSGGSAYITWLFIPTADAGGEDPRGKDYFIGGTFYAYANGGLVKYPLYPDRITVRPQPKLDIDYFLPRDVDSDDPFTLDQIEEQVPFDLGVRIKNVGYGAANNMTLASGQPRIVENTKGLLVAFRLLNSYLGNAVIPNPSLTMNFGNLPAQTTKVGRWSMVSTLMGEFTEFEASYTHASELGGQMTSLIVSLDTNFLTHTMLIAEPGFDTVPDFLADTTKDDDDLMPETIFSSEGQEFPVNTLASTGDGPPTNQDPVVRVTMANPVSGWVYTRLDDPSQGLQNVVSVRRSDGKQIAVPQNAWITKKIVRKLGQPTRVDWKLHIVDVNSTGIYDVTFQAPPPDSLPPVTTIVMQQPFYGANPLFYGTEATEFFLLATDNVSGVANTLWSIDGSPYVPAYPTRLSAEGLHTIEYYSVDRTGNAEPARQFQFVVDRTPPAIDTFNAPTSFIPMRNAAARETDALVVAKATDGQSPEVDLTIDIARGSAATPAEFDALTAVRQYKARVASGTTKLFPWNGRDTAGNIVTPGAYTIRFTAADPLGHAVAQVRSIVVAETYPSAALSASVAGEQINADIDGQIAVWQDSRNGNWDIYTYNLATSTEKRLTTETADQQRPRVSGNRVVWQDRRSGNDDIYMYDLGTNTTAAVATGSGTQSRPDIDGDYIVWRGDDTGNAEIYLKQISTGTVTQITSNVAVQDNPRIHGGTVVYEDFRTGLADIYQYDIAAGTTTQLTTAAEQQEEPDVQSGRAVWTDKRSGTREIYSKDGAAAEVNLTNDTPEQAEPDAAAAFTAFTTYAPSAGDPNIAVAFNGFSKLLLLTEDSASQRKPAADGLNVLWQDARGTGRNQIRRASLARPVADAGPDLLTSSLQPVVLDGTGSRWFQGGSPTYQWTQVAGPAATLSGATTATANFAAPLVTAETVLAFELTLTESGVPSVPDLVIVTIRPGNLPPAAEAGPAQSVTARATVTLDGRGSSDPDGDALAPTWEQLEGPSVELDRTIPMQPRFVAPDVTTPTMVLFSLRVFDGQYTSLPDKVAITVNPRVNQPPVARVASDLSVNEREAATLDGSASYDPEALPISYQWTQVSGPAVTLQGATTAKPTFTAPVVSERQEAIFRLVVRDEAAPSAPADVTVEIRNVRHLPLANAGPDRTVAENTAITLDGRASSHPDGLPYSFSWSQIAGPTVTLSNTGIAQPTFTAPRLRRNYTVTFRLIVADDLQGSVPDTVVVSITSPNRAPTVNAGADRALVASVVNPVLLTASSSDPDGDALTYRWTQISGPPVTLTNATTATARFISGTPLQPVVYTFQVVANDGGYDSNTDTVTITIQPAVPGDVFMIR